jgi:DNA mismatch repair protein MutS
VKAKTLFATHYYELTALKDLPGTKNFRITVKEKGEDVIFLRKIVPGEADKSYGIQVARLAGLPVSIIKRAKELLAEHEAGDHDRVMSQIASASDSQSYQPSQIGIDFMNEQEVLEDIKAVDINSMSPLEALNFLFSIKSKLD